MIAQSQVMAVLRPWLGAPLLEALSPLTANLAGRLNGFSIQRGEDHWAQEIDSALFLAVRRATRGSMLAQLEDGTYVRVRLEDFSAMADELLFLSFDAFPLDEAHLKFLRDYSMRHESLSALRALYTRFADMQTAQELTMISSVVKKCYPPFRWRHWLDAPEGL